MPTFIKTGLWFKSREGHKGTLNLENLIKDTTASTSETYRDFTETTEPDTPPAGTIRMWMDSTGALFVKNDAGTVKEIQFVNL